MLGLDKYKEVKLNVVFLPRQKKSVWTCQKLDLYPWLDLLLLDQDSIFNYIVESLYLKLGQVVFLVAIDERGPYQRGITAVFTLIYPIYLKYFEVKSVVCFNLSQSFDYKIKSAYPVICIYSVKTCLTGMSLWFYFSKYTMYCISVLVNWYWMWSWPYFKGPLSSCKRLVRQYCLF